MELVIKENPATVSSLVCGTKLGIFITIYCNYISKEKEMKIKLTVLLYGIPESESCSVVTVCEPMDYTQSMEFSRPEYWNG